MGELIGDKWLPMADNVHRGHCGFHRAATALNAVFWPSIPSLPSPWGLRRLWGLWPGGYLQESVNAIEEEYKSLRDERRQRDQEAIDVIMEMVKESAANQSMLQKLAAAIQQAKGGPR